jgi:hypothetical protein
LKLKSLHIIQGLGLAGQDTLRIPPAKITLVGTAPVLVKCHGARRTCGNAHLTPDAQILIDHHPVEFIIPIDGLLRTYRHARGILTMLANDWEVESLAFQDIDAGALRVAQPRIFERTGCHAFHAAVAFERVCYQNSTIHKSVSRVFCLFIIVNNVISYFKNLFKTCQEFFFIFFKIISNLLLLQAIMNPKNNSFLDIH